MAEIREGYKETEIGIIPEDWEVRSVYDVSEKVCVGFVGSLSRFYTNSDTGVPLIRTTNLTENFIDEKDMKYVSQEFHEKNKKSQLIKGDILVARHGSNGKACLFNKTYEANALNVVIIRPDLNSINELFLKESLNGKASHKQVLNSLGGSVQKVINTRDVSSMQISVPPLKEQEKIAEILSSTDKHIEDLDRLIEDYELLKKGMVQKLLTEGIGHTEFKDTEIGRIPKVWEVRSLGECFEFFSGYSAPRSELSDKGVLYLHYGDIHLSTKSYIDTDEDSKWLPRFKIKREKKGTFLDHGDIVFADASEDYEGVGKSVVIYRGSQRIVSGLHTIVAKDISCNLGISYKRYFLNAHFVRKQFKRLATGAKVYGIAKGNIGKIVFAIPPIDEQEIIGETLANIENQISLLKKNKDQINILKQALMDRLLTGEIRVV